MILRLNYNFTIKKKHNLFVSSDFIYKKKEKMNAFETIGLEISQICEMIRNINKILVKNNESMQMLNTRMTELEKRVETCENLLEKSAILEKDFKELMFQVD